MTTTTKYQNRSTGEIIEIRADFAQASSPILVRHEDGHWVGTGFQVADARHRRHLALRLVLNIGLDQ